MRTRLLALLAVMVAVLLPASTAAAAPSSGPPTATPIKHFVMLMQDNHSFDNYFGTYPGADGIPPGVCQRLNLARSSMKGCIASFHLGDTPSDDLSHGVGIQKRQYDDGKMDGFVAAYRRLGRDGTSAMGYYDGSDLPYYWNAADQYVLFDRFFSSTTVGSRESYLYWLAGQAPASSKPLTTSAGYDQLSTIFDRLNAQKVSAKFYVENLDARVTAPGKQRLARSSQLVKVPLLSMKRFQDGGPLAGRVVDLSEYYNDLRRGTLPAVSYIVTSGSSENPPARVSVGQKTVRKLTSELIKSPYWSSSAFMLTYDGWGGWYDHVAPPKVDARGYGFRVPALLVSPYAKQGVIDHTVLDYTAMLKFIETNWHLGPLASRDAASEGLGAAFDFSTEPRPAALISSSRDDEGVPANAAHAPSVIYTAYGAALAGVAATVMVVTFSGAPFRRMVVPRALLPLWWPASRHRPRRALVENHDSRAWTYWQWLSPTSTVHSRPRRAAKGSGTAAVEWIHWYEHDSPEARRRLHDRDVDEATAQWMRWYESMSLAGTRSTVAGGPGRSPDGIEPA